MKSILIRFVTILGVIFLISLLSVVVLFIMSHFTPLHPDAYRDMVRSIVIVSGIFFIPYMVIIILSRTRWFKQTFQRLQGWMNSLTPIMIICGSFTIVTAMNSLMMITGIDTPKQGVFAYVHMLTRLGIIVLIIGVWKWRDMLQLFASMMKKTFWKGLIALLSDSLSRSVSQLFTLLTLVYCLFMISFSSLLNPSGGQVFYLILLGLLGFSMIFVVSMRLMRKE